jgi:hypothetical protein
MTGLSAVVGSWKIIAMRVQRSDSRPTLRCADRAPRPASRIEPAGHAQRARQKTHRRVRDHALARAGLADQAHDLVGRDAEPDVVHGVNAIGAARQADRQSRDVEDGAVHVRYDRIVRIGCRVADTIAPKGRSPCRRAR